MKKGRPDIRCDSHREVRRIVPPQRRENHDEIELVDKDVETGRRRRHFKKQ